MTMAIKKYSVKASAQAKKTVVASAGEYISAAQFSDTLKSAKKKFNEKFKKGPYACAEVQGMGYIYYNDGSKIYVPNVLRSYDDALAQVKKLNAGGTGKVAASKKFTAKASKSVKAAATLVRENDMEIVLRDDDGAELRVVKHPTVRGYRLRRTLNNVDDSTFQWDLSKEIYDTAEEAKQAALEGKATFHFKGRKTIPPKPVQSSTNSKTTKKQFGVKASKSAKKGVSAAKGYWADDINAESYRKILQTLDDYLIANYDGKTIGDVEIGVSGLRSVKNGIGSKIEIMFYCPDYNKDTKLEIISAPELRSKFLGRVSDAPFKFDDEFMIRQPGCKQVVVDKINEIADMLSNGSIEGACGKKHTVKASTAAKKRKAIKASGVQNDIVMYFNGDNVYQGSVYDLADAVENLCYDDEVNIKFQEWCNQFGDPFDFDGSPIDTAEVFTDIIIHEAEESPVSEDGQSEFYVDGNDILDFEITYADEFSIDGAKSIRCWDNGNDVWEYQESYDDYYDDADMLEDARRLGDLSEQLKLDWFAKFIELHPDENEYDRESWPDVDEAVGYTLDEAQYSPEKIKASTDITATNSLNLDAKPNYTDWILRGYRFDGEDVTTLRIDFQDDVKQAVMDMFADPDIETVDLYKIPTEQETTGVFEDEEYFNTITRDDFESSADINAAIDIGNKTKYSDNPIYEFSDYVYKLSDGVQKILGDDFEVTASDEAITFTKDGEVVYIQPTEEIIPEPEDLESDIDELATAVNSVLYDKAMREDFDRALDETYDEDYATQAVELSRDINCAEETVDIDDLEYIMGDSDDLPDMGYGYDSNGDPITESTVEELYRIAQNIVYNSEIAKIDEYASIEEDSFEYYSSAPYYVSESYWLDLTVTMDYDTMNKLGFIAPDSKMWSTVDEYKIPLKVKVKNSEVTHINYADPYSTNATYGFQRYIDLMDLDMDAVHTWAEELVSPVAMEIYNATTNI